MSKFYFTKRALTLRPPLKNSFFLTKQVYRRKCAKRFGFKQTLVQGSSQRIKGIPDILRFLGSDIFFNIIDIASVAACFWTIFCLLYITFLKDSAEILFYAAVKYARRLKWLYCIIKMEHTSKLNDIHKFPTTSKNSTRAPFDVVNTMFVHSEDSVCNLNARNEEQRSPSCTKKHTMSPHSACSTSNSTNNEKQLTTKCSPSSAILRQLPKCSSTSPVGSTSNQTITPRSLNFEHCTIDETNFENIDLESEKGCEIETVFISTVENPRSIQSSSAWKFNRSEILDSFRAKCSNFRSPGCARMKRQNLATKIAEVLPTQVEDKEALIGPSDSPEQIGCCGTFFHLLRSRFQVDHIIPSCPVYYKRF